MLDSTIETKNKSNVYYMTGVAILLGFLFDYLFFEKSFGISVLIFEAVFIGFTLWFSARFHYAFRPTLWLLGLTLFFAAMTAVHANLFLTFLNIVATLGLLLLATQEFLKKPIINFRIPDYITTIVTTPFKIFRRFLQTLFFISKPSQKSSTAVLKRITIGIIMALPFLLFFGALFASADLGFKNLVDSIFTFNISDEFVGHVILVIGIFVFSLGLFAYLFNIPPEINSSEIPEDHKSEKEVIDRNIEVRVFLWLIAALFGIFLIFQIAYLFGGAINISHGNLTYAEYARKGFWELLTVGLFTLLILLIMDKYTKRSTSRLTWFTLPSLVLIVEIFIIIISAFKRLMLYQVAYGLTTLRLYVAGFIIFLGIIFIVLAIKLWREKQERFFAFASLLAIITFLIVVNILNPDAFIAQKNIDRFNQTGKIDAHYLGTMSVDAVPKMLNVYDRLKDEDKAILKQLISVKKSDLDKQTADWQSYNMSRHKALTEINNRIIQ